MNWLGFTSLSFYSRFVSYCLLLFEFQNSAAAFAQTHVTRLSFSRNSIIFAFSVYFLPKTTFFSDYYLFVCIKKFEIWLRDQFSEFSSVGVCYSLYLQARIFLSVARAVKSTRRKGIHKFVFFLSRGEIWCFIAINPLNNLKF